MSDKTVALFIDSDNAPATKISAILEKLAELGSTSIKRAYGNWQKAGLKSWEEQLHPHGIQPIQQFDLTKGKNASDIAMTIDMMDVLYGKNVDIFAIMTSDCDFTPLATRIRAEGKTVIGFGESKAPEAFINSCSKFVNIDRLNGSQESDEKIEKASAKQLKCDSKLISMIRNGIDAYRNDEGWAEMSKVCSYISNLSSITPENYGFSKISDVVKAIDLFKFTKNENNHWLLKDEREESAYHAF